MNEIDWVQFHKQTQAMEEYLRYQQEPETKRPWPTWISFWKKGQPIPSSTEHRVECQSPANLPEELYEKWLEIGSEEELNEFYVDPKTNMALRQYEKHSKLVIQNAL